MAPRKKSLRSLLKEARKEDRVLSAEEIQSLRESAVEQMEDHQGTVDAIRSSYVSILKIESGFSGGLKRTPAVTQELDRHKRFIADCKSAFIEAGFPQAEADRVEGAAMCRALLTFANELDTYEAREFALQEAVRRENFRGPLSKSEEKEAREKRIPIVRGRRGVYAAINFQKPIISGLVTALWKSLDRIRAKEEGRRADHDRKVAETSGKLELCFRKGADGIVAFKAPWSSNGREFDVFIELEFRNGDTTVKDATGEFARLTGETFTRDEIPGFLKAAIHRGIERVRKNRKQERKTNVLPLSAKAG